MASVRDRVDSDGPGEKKTPAEGTGRDAALAAEGWERRFIADAQRAKEAAELYERLGFEVRAEPLGTEDLEEGCDDCRLVTALQFRILYTRKKPGR